MTRPFTFFCVLALFFAAGCAQDPQPVEDDMNDDPAYMNTVVDAADQAGLSTFNVLVTEADLTTVLTTGGPYTVFAPSDEAFGALDAETVQTLRQPENRDALRSVLTYHVIEGTFLSADLSGEQTVETVNGESITISATDEGVTLTDALGNTARVISADLQADNGVVHVIDSVMLPAAPAEILGVPADAEAEPAMDADANQM